jgi:hypothetical protein
VVTLALILAVAALLRAERLGRLSFWYDEVVTIRLARTAGPAALVDLLGRIDATRAPLHPLLLQGWVKAFGASEASGRAFSAVCGVLTVALIARVGRRAFDDPRAGLWAAALAALSPLLLVYSREARMYAWLALVTCAAWDALLGLRSGASAWRLSLYAAAVAALVYSHPLGLLMAAALATASLVCRRALGLSWGRWLAPHLAASAAVAPWVGRYFDHPPESSVGRLPLRFLLGLPIGFTGGNFLTLLGFVLVIGYGVFTFGRDDRGRLRLGLAAPLATACLLIWLVLPPALLYAYSRVAHPIFGPARYTLFVAPAYLILLGRGLARLPHPVGLATGLVAAALSASAWPAVVFAPDLKADWRASASALDRRDPSGAEPVVVVATDPARNVEVETARYYLAPRRQAVAMPTRPEEIARLIGGSRTRVWVAVGVRDGRLAAPLPPTLHPRRDADLLDVAGLRLIALDPGDL